MSIRTVPPDITTRFLLSGSDVIKQTDGTDTLWFYRDAAGSLTGFELNETAYFYVKNLQGNVIAITDETGIKVTEYLYDSWGKLISVTGSQAATAGAKNPFRYRGYYFDTETGLYYVSSRYYDSEVKRFINADECVSTGQDIFGNNRFEYCSNNPIDRIDGNGEFWHIIIGAVIGGLFEIGNQVIC